MLRSVNAGIARLNGACEFTCGCEADAWGWKNNRTISSRVTRAVIAVPKCDTQRPIPNPGTFTNRITANNSVVNAAIKAWLSSIQAAREPNPYGAR